MSHEEEFADQDLEVRRHRLAEVLFGTALDAPTTDSVCAFLGHPRLCPHGKPIPAGPCCQSLSQSKDPLVEPLDRLAPGEAAHIVYILPRAAERLVRLAGLGVVPGALVHFQQRTPAAVLRVGETTVALDPAVAAEIYVRRVQEA